MTASDDKTSHNLSRDIIETLDEIVFHTKLLAFQRAWETEHVKDKIEVDEETSGTLRIMIESKPPEPTQDE